MHTSTLPNGNPVKDLSLLGRDLTKVCIIDNTKSNFELQPKNGLHILPFYDNQKDTELKDLLPDLLKIAKDNYDDIRKSLEGIRSNMKKRYKALGYKTY